MSTHTQSDITRDRIKKRMAELNVSANFVSSNSGLDRSTLRKYLSNGAAKISAETLLRIAQTLKCDVAYLLGEQGDIPQDIFASADRDREISLIRTARERRGEFAEDVRRFANSNDYSISQLSSVLGIYPVILYDIMNGRFTPSAELQAVIRLRMSSVQSAMEREGASGSLKISSLSPKAAELLAFSPETRSKVSDELDAEEAMHTLTPRVPVTLLSRNSTQDAGAAPSDYVAGPEASRLAMDVPVYGFAAGASGDETDDQFYMNGQIANYVRRPPGVTNMRGVFGVYVRGESMTPKFEPGELVFATSAQQPAIGDYVVIELHSLNPESEFGDDANTPARGIIKRLVKRSGSKLHFEQFNPAKPLVFDREEIKALHRVLSTNDLYGV